MLEHKADIHAKAESGWMYSVCEQARGGGAAAAANLLSRIGDLYRRYFSLSTISNFESGESHSKYSEHPILSNQAFSLIHTIVALNRSIICV